MDIETRAKIEQIYGINPSFGAFKENLPSRVIFVRPMVNLIKSGKINSGQKIAQGISIHWEETSKQITLVSDTDAGSVVLKIPTKIGGFMSLTWSINDEILQLYQPNLTISFGFNEIDFEKTPPLDGDVTGNLYLVKGKVTEKQSTTAGFYEGRLQVSFNMVENETLWKTATRGWIEIMISNPKFNTLTLTDPLLWVQSRLVD